MENKKRILHVLASNKFSGAENVACTIIENMSDEYEMAYCSPDGEIRKSLLEKKIKYYGVKTLSIKELKKVIEAFKPDVIHAHDFKASFISSKFSKKIIIISHLHKNDPKMAKISLKSILYMFASRKFKNIVGVSNSVLDEYIFKNKIKKKYITLFNYIDKEKIINLSKKNKVNKQYDLFYFGRLSDEKNPLEFIEIVNLLRGNNIKCLMIGDGPLRKKCEELIKEYNLQDNIDMVGFQSNPYPYINASKICIMPSKFEGFGLAAIECNILKKPVFNSGVGGLNSIFLNNDKFKCYSINEYAKKILEYKNEKQIIDNRILDKQMFVEFIKHLY